MIPYWTFFWKSIRFYVENLPNLSWLDTFPLSLSFRLREEKTNSVVICYDTQIMVVIMSHNLALVHQRFVLTPIFWSLLINHFLLRFWQQKGIIFWHTGGDFVLQTHKKPKYIFNTVFMTLLVVLVILWYWLNDTL